MPTKPARLTALLLMVILPVPMAAGVLPPSNHPAGEAAPPALSARAAVLMDVASGRVLYARASEEPLAPASLTKILTALLAIESGRLEDPVTIGSSAAGVEGSSIYLEPGETLTLRELLQGLMMRSGNDAAVAIAEHVAGSLAGFRGLMNQRAESLGAASTNFENPHGLPHPGHLTTATDMARITRAALLRTEFRAIVGARRATLPWADNPWQRVLDNENRFLRLYPGADGVKTGWTSQAGRCLAASATRDDWSLLVILLNAPNLWADAEALMDWGFGRFEPVCLYAPGVPVARARVAGGSERWVALGPGSEVRVAVRRGESDPITTVTRVPLAVRSPVAVGDGLGVMSLIIDGEALPDIDLTALEAVPAATPVGRFYQEVWLTLASVLGALLGEAADADRGAIPPAASGQARPGGGRGCAPCGKAP